MTIPAIPSLSAGQVVQLSDLQALAYAAQFALTKPITRIRDDTGGASIATSLGTPMTFTTAVFDTDSMWASGTPNRLTVQTPGFYAVRYAVNVGINGGVYTAALASTTGSNNPQGSGVQSAYAWGASTDVNGGNHAWATGGGDWPFYLYAGDYLQVFIEAAATGSSTGTGAPGTATTPGSYLEMELVSI